MITIIKKQGKQGAASIGAGSCKKNQIIFKNYT